MLFKLRQILYSKLPALQKRIHWQQEAFSYLLTCVFAVDYFNYSGLNMLALIMLSIFHGEVHQRRVPQ